MTTHNLSHKVPEYEIWQAMKQRCSNPNSKDFPDYGGRGISVCERWQEFESFYADMGRRPDGGSLDRYPDNDGNYEPGNCRWATAREQSMNRRNARFVKINGESRRLIEICTERGMSYAIVFRRITYQGWAIDRALTQVAGPNGRRKLGTT